MLDALMDGDAHPAGDLARQAGVALSTASGHLASLVEVGFVNVERVGRQRRYRLAGPDVARAVEALAAIAPRRPVSSLRGAMTADRLRAGRTCYDHLAGRLGVAVTDALAGRGALRLRGEEYLVTRSGVGVFEDLGVDLAAARARRRGFAFACQDWTERRAHLAGALGAALCRRWFELGWIRRSDRGRAVNRTAAGSAGLHSLLGIEPDTA